MGIEFDADDFRKEEEEIYEQQVEERKKAQKEVKKDSTFTREVSRRGSKEGGILDLIGSEPLSDIDEVSEYDDEEEDLLRELEDAERTRSADLSPEQLAKETEDRAKKMALAMQKRIEAETGKPLTDEEKKELFHQSMKKIQNLEEKRNKKKGYERKTQ